MAGTTTFYGVSYPTNTDFVKDGANAIQTVATGFDSAVAIPTYNAQTGTSYTFVLSDTGKTVTASNAAATSYTIPPTASVAWTANTTLNVVNLGVGVVTFVAGAGVTVTNSTATIKQYQAAKLVRTALNAWTVVASDVSSGLNLIKSQVIGAAVSSVTVTGAFSATFDNYKVIISSGVGSVAGINLSLKLGASATTYNHGYTGVSNAAAAIVGYSASDASWTFAGAANTNYIDFDVDFINPFLVKYTLMKSQARTATSFTATYCNHLTAASYTDLTITPATGTLTGGTIYVYGYGIY